MKPAIILPGERAREALSEATRERAPVPYLAVRSSRANVSPQIVDVTGEKPSSGFAFFMAGALCAALLLAALYFSI